jgi:hypothetical protein
MVRSNLFNKVNRNCVFYLYFVCRTCAPNTSKYVALLDWLHAICLAHSTQTQDAIRAQKFSDLWHGDVLVLA